MLSGSVPSQENVLSQQLRAAHRLETSQKTLSDSLSASVCSRQATCKVFLERRDDAGTLEGGVLGLVAGSGKKFCGVVILATLWYAFWYGTR